MAKYDHQMRLILANIFHKKDKVYTKTPANWIRKMTNIVGGTMYQHAHADQAWPFELEGERTFPFVASHGFGVHPMQIWLLPKSDRGKNEYGILHQLPPTAMLFMRGDFVHAGGAMWHPRCHMKFYPRAAAGLVHARDDNYWLLPNFKDDISEETSGKKIENVFLWQHYNFPFGFPQSKRTYNAKQECVDEILTYPPELTTRLLRGKSAFAALGMRMEVEHGV
jgi:hypothetical protein